uniref:Uncharacterized protein n=1 Tax=Porphyridium purpureum TaxID=35688 RepID=W0RYK5_PORPP|nr:hypothetical protein Y721_p029 [Porphyridium purpureum]BAO23779.1 hypothetical protein [Porphyridium purpureum]
MYTSLLTISVLATNKPETTIPHSPVCPGKVAKALAKKNQEAVLLNYMKSKLKNYNNY